MTKKNKLTINDRAYNRAKLVTDDCMNPKFWAVLFAYKAGWRAAKREDRIQRRGF